VTGIPGAQQEADGPSIAQVYDYLLRGSHYFAADRVSAEEMLTRWPDAPKTMHVNRAFLGRAVRYLAGQAGIRQFLDIGSGIPTMGNVHEIAQQAAPEARVVYADIDSVAVLHSRAILARNDRATAIQADLRQPRGNPGAPGVARPAGPVSACRAAAGSSGAAFLPRCRSAGGPGRRTARCPDPGSYVVISHGTTDGQPQHVADAMDHDTRTAGWTWRRHCSRRPGTVTSAGTSCCLRRTRTAGLLTGVRSRKCP
jgi:hypothetical protein